MIKIHELIFPSNEIFNTQGVPQDARLHWDELFKIAAEFSTLKQDLGSL